MSWRCPCGEIMSFSICKCGVCGEKKSRGESLVVMRGDWLCKLCGKNNFAKRKKCFGCGAQKNVDAGKRILEVGDTTAAKRQKVSSGKVSVKSCSSKDQDEELNRKMNINDTDEDDDEALLSEILNCPQ
ncbi:hypothetical protein ACHWQZ_G015656 [Mnemiopsis leidyi]